MFGCAAVVTVPAVLANGTVPDTLAPGRFVKLAPEPAKVVALANVPRAALFTVKLPVAASIVAVPTVNPFFTTKFLVAIFFLFLS